MKLTKVPFTPMHSKRGTANTNFFTFENILFESGDINSKLKKNTSLPPPCIIIGTVLMQFHLFLELF